MSPSYDDERGPEGPRGGASDEDTTQSEWTIRVKVRIDEACAARLKQRALAASMSEDEVVGVALRRFLDTAAAAGLPEEEAPVGEPWAWTTFVLDRHLEMRLRQMALATRPGMLTEAALLREALRRFLGLG